jgi:hypothetical protein
MGNPKYNEPTSFEEMEEQVEKTEAPKTEAPVAQDPGKTVEQTEATE